MITDWCKFFAAIEADPTAMISGMTVRDFDTARTHISECTKCYDVCERVATRQPADPKLFMEN